MNSAIISGQEDLLELRSLLRSSKVLVLQRAALVQFIDRFLDGKLTTSELQEVGDLLEGEPVDYADDSDQTIAQVLFEMSSPEVNGPIDRNAAMKWKAMLSQQTEPDN